MLNLATGGQALLRRLSQPALSRRNVY